ncbi:hypothetical protein CXB51_021591 [Gossypium anomalum]|uniref:DUF7745 domain-containing protein n=1 Tax=Gossypium anomalum TaxID=47600 RepID=A0A8J6CZ25_9ROSI|nr:hypothetical protein CXB51_021591 [Gossypium anomalum]
MRPSECGLIERNKKGDSLTEGYESELWDFTYISVTQNNLKELRDIWNSWNSEVKQLFYCNYGDLPYLHDVKVDKYLFRSLAQFWNPAYTCFTFGGVDLVPTIEEYTALLNCPKIQVDRAYSRPINVLTFLKKLMKTTGMSEQWVSARIKQKGDSKCIPWRNLRDLILAHPDMKKRVDVFALSLYGLIIFPKVLGHIDEAVSDLFDRFDKGTTPIPVILAETFRSLNACQRAGEGRFISCAQLLLAWFHSHFWKVEKVSYRVFSKDYSPLRELVATSRRDDISKEKWITILQNLRAEDVPLAGIWGAAGYAPLMVLSQYRSRQFIPVTQRLAQCEFPYKDNNYKKKVREISDDWNRTRRMKGFTTSPMTTLRMNGGGEKESMTTSQYRVRNRDYVIGEAVAQVREIADHLQILAVQADVLSLRYESKLYRGRNLAWLLKKVKALGIRAKSYM